MPEKISIDYNFDLGGYGGKLFDVKPTKMTFGVEIEGLEKSSKTGKEIFAKIETGLRKEIITSLDKQRDNFKLALKEADVGAYKNAAKAKGGQAAIEKQLDEQVKGLNVMINRSIPLIESETTKKIDGICKDVIDAMAKALKTELKKLKVKGWLKIGALGGVVLASAAVTLVVAGAGTAGTIMTAGGAAPIFVAVAGVSVTALSVTGKSAVAMYKTYQTHSSNHKNAHKGLQSALQDYKDALDYEQKKVTKQADGESLGPRERVKLLLGNTSGKRKTVESALKIMETHTQSMYMNNMNYLGQINKVGAEVDKLLAAKDAPKKAAAALSTQQKKLKEMQTAVRASARKLQEYESTMTEVETLMKEPVPPVAKLGSVVSKLQAVQGNEYFQAVVDFGSVVFDNVFDAAQNGLTIASAV